MLHFASSCDVHEKQQTVDMQMIALHFRSC